MKLRTWCIRIGQNLTKTVLVCTVFLVFLTLFCPQLTKAENDRGGITIRHQNVPIEKVFQSIEKQSGYRFFYNETLLQGAGKVTLNLQNVSLQEALEACFRNQPLSYAIVEKTIIVKKRPEQQQSTAPIPTAVSFNKPGKIIALRGKVTSNNTPIVGASIMIKGTDNGASTDKDGMFTLPEVEDDATLVISSVSHTLREIKLNGQTYIDIDLAKKADDLDEAVVVAYNTTTQKRNTSSITVVKGEQIATLPNRSFDKSLQGLVPGLLVNSGTGQPGSAMNNFVLRGIATGGIPTSGQTFRSPLVVVDGVPVYQDPVRTGTSSGQIAESNPMAQLNPSDIESITVLKDAAAISLYGSKASNGVLLVTTKKGKGGKTTFNFRHQTDINERLKDPAVLNQDEYLELLFEAYRNSFPSMTDAQILADLRSSPSNQLTSSPYFPVIVNSPGDTSFYSAPDWNAEFYKKAAVTLANQLSMSGGNDRSTFYLNLEYTKQDGVIKGSDFDRKSIRFNYENKVTSWFKLGLNTTSSYSIQNYSAGSENVLSASPLLPIRLTNGKYVDNYSWGMGLTGSSFIANPILGPKLNINRNTSYRSLSKVYGEVKLLKYFTFNSNVGIDFIINENKTKTHPRFVLSGETATGNGSIADQTVRNAILIVTNILRFDRTIKKDHSINFMAGQEAQILSNKFTVATIKGIGANPTATDPVQGTGTLSGYGNTDKQTLLSYFGQANYGFRDKYFLTGSIRTDGSSRFGDNKRFGTYWSVGGGWVVTAEPFMSKINNWLNYLKLRGSFGAAGNSAAIDGLLRYDRLTILNYLNNPVVIPNTIGPGNPEIRWEETFTWDAGLEARFWKDRISITGDLYNRKTSNLIAYGGIILPAATGFTSMTGNIGDLKNSGIELSFSLDVIRSKNFRWNVNANWSKNTSKLTKLFTPRVGIGSNLVNMVGEEYSSFYLKRWEGVNPDNGRPQWTDSTNGKPTENYNAAKPEIAGKTQPDGFGAISTSFSYKGFELSGMMYYQYGYQIYLHNLLQNDGLYPFMNQSRNALNRWQHQGDDAANPRRLLNGKVGTVTDQGTSPSSRYICDGDFIRLSNIALAYNFPKKLLERIHLTSLKVYIQGHNLGTWTKYTGQDPENTTQNGGGNYLYPQQRSYSLGLNLNF